MPTASYRSFQFREEIVTEDLAPALPFVARFHSFCRLSAELRRSEPLIATTGTQETVMKISDVNRCYGFTAESCIAVSPPTQEVTDDAL